MEVYLDHAATTPAKAEVVQAVVRALEREYGNPSSLHRKGVEVEKSIKAIRRSLAKALGCAEQELYFTSGGTEANNMAIRGIAEAYKRAGKHMITTKIEHPSVLNTFKELETKGYEVTYLDVDSRGFISLQELSQNIRTDTILVSIMMVNNEVGSIQPVAEAGKLIKQKNKQTLFHVDAIQAFGKLKLRLEDMQVDCLSISGHKIHAPKGIGALYIRKDTKIAPIITGGGQEMGLRVGTENVPGIYGLGAAVELIAKDQPLYIDRLVAAKQYFLSRLKESVDNTIILSPLETTFAPHIVAVSFTGVKSEVLLHSLEQEKVYVSSGSACSSKKKGFSHVLTAMKLKESVIDSTIRFSLSDITTTEELDYAIDKINKQVTLLRRIMKR